MFKLITDRRTAQTSFQTFKRTMQHPAALHRKVWVGWRPRAEQLDIHWNSEQHFWCHFGSVKGRYWCDFGIEDPSEVTKLSITVEINPPHRGTNGRVAGAFVRGPDGHIYVAHSGKVGGGRKGISKAEFSHFYRGGNWHGVVSGSTSREMIILGRVDRPNLVNAISHFTHEVARFKAAVEAGQLPSSSEQGKVDAYDPEFSGTKIYPLGGNVEAECLHGVVVDALANALSVLGVEVANDKTPRSVYNNHTRHAFRNQDGYFDNSSTVGSDNWWCMDALGQQLVLVVPGDVSDGFERSLGKLGISTLKYEWSRSKPRFKNLSALMRK